MAEALYKLHAWLSPAYPVGAYTYSHGLEAAIGEGAIRDLGSAQAWIADCLEHGAGRNDAILLALAWRAALNGDNEELREVAVLASALIPSSERLLETEAQGRAFAEVTEAVWGGVEPAPYPVVIGQAAAVHGIPLAETLTLYLQAFASNLVSAAIRLVPLGQTEGQAMLAAFLSSCQQVTEEAMRAGPDDIGGAALLSDIASTHHETQEIRLFRT